MHTVLELRQRKEEYHRYELKGILLDNESEVLGRTQHS